jgi:hypothetical protein
MLFAIHLTFLVQDHPDFPARFLIVLDDRIDESTFLSPDSRQTCVFALLHQGNNDGLPAIPFVGNRFLRRHLE